ncbi:DUF4398 domain-containing protein [Coralloluteibacterium stylophorae]|uniref:DUF4398 domain-containing protein n=2 Tax=Coralloluteibacterium stylophorae TaxID=1776034 RepID=A0AAP2CC67_9GAMM|nr:DUF4398 domain-containing protein [Coralloluteibacterium stylophorae]MBS7457842.1 DUF4398 domain-containing protein [Coralloluteibacterium stylophorae]
MTVPTLKIHRLAGLAAGLCALLLASCATVPPPTAELGAAEAAVLAASRADADQHAPEVIADARERLSAAQSANASGDYVEAGQLAREAEAAAELAVARGRLAVASAKVRAESAENARLRARLNELGE